MPEPQHDAAAMARAVPAHQLGSALAGGIGMSYMDLPGRPDDAPELEAARARNATGRPLPGMEEILPGVPSRLRAAQPPDDGDHSKRGHVRDGFRRARLMHTIAPPDWWD